MVIQLNTYFGSENVQLSVYFILCHMKSFRPIWKNIIDFRFVASALRN